MSIQQMFLGAGGGKVFPEWLDALLIAGGGTGTNPGAGGIVGFTDHSSNTSGTPWNFTDTTYDFGGTWNVYPGAISDNSYMTAALAAGGIENPAKSVTAIAGGDAPNPNAAGNSGGSGSGGGAASGANTGGGMGTLTGYGGLSQQGNSGGNGWWATEYQDGRRGGGGGFSTQGQGGYAYAYIDHGHAGAGSNNQAPSTNHYIWLGISDDSSYTGQFSQGGGKLSTAWGHWLTPKPGDGNTAGLIAIRYSSEADDPNVTGSPSFYTDTTNSKRIAVWTQNGTFTWS